MIGIEKKPEQLTPVYNEMLIVATSSNIDKKGFKFVADVYCRSELVSRLKIAVNPDGYGVFDISRHIQSVMSFDFDNENYGFNKAVNSFATYSVDLREEYYYDWEFYDIDSVDGFLGLIGTVSTIFEAGDEIVVQQDAPNNTPFYNGLATIISITESGGEYIIKTNKVWNGKSGTQSGNIVLSYYRTYISDVEDTTGTLYAFNGVLDFVDFINWDPDYYAATVSGGNFLTNMPDNYKVKIENQMFLNIYNTVPELVEYLLIESNTGKFAINNPYYELSGDDYEKLVQVACGPYDLLTHTSSILVITGSLPVIDDDTKEYTIWCDKAIDEKVIKIDRSCSRYENIELIFMDKLGSFIPFNFNLVSRNNKNITRTNYGQNYMGYGNSVNNWNYKTYDRGTRTLDILVNEEFTINSNWLDQSTSDFIMELFESPEVYWKKSVDVYVAINIMDIRVEKKKIVNDQLINYTVMFELSVKNNKQK